MSPCMCGHEHDEHDPKTLECQVEGCRCDYYDADEEDPDA